MRAMRTVRGVQPPVSPGSAAATSSMRRQRRVRQRQRQRVRVVVWVWVVMALPRMPRVQRRNGARTVVPMAMSMCLRLCLRMRMRVWVWMHAMHPAMNPTVVRPNTALQMRLRVHGVRRAERALLTLHMMSPWRTSKMPAAAAHRERRTLHVVRAVGVVRRREMRRLHVVRAERGERKMRRRRHVGMVWGKVGGRESVRVHMVGGGETVGLRSCSGHGGRLCGCEDAAPSLWKKR